MSLRRDPGVISSRVPGARRQRTARALRLRATRQRRKAQMTRITLPSRSMKTTSVGNRMKKVRTLLAGFKSIPSLTPSCDRPSPRACPPRTLAAVTHRLVHPRTRCE